MTVPLVKAEVLLIQPPFSQSAGGCFHLLENK